MLVQLLAKQQQSTTTTGAPEIGRWVPILAVVSTEAVGV
jgi:hypothetical protein